VPRRSSRGLRDHLIMPDYCEYDFTGQTCNQKASSASRRPFG